MDSMELKAWVLIISSWRSSKNEVEQLGYYANKSSCLAVQRSEPIKNFDSECVQVLIVK